MTTYADAATPDLNDIQHKLREARATLDLILAGTTNMETAAEFLEYLDAGTLYQAVHSAIARIDEASAEVERLFPLLHRVTEQPGGEVRQ